MPAREKQFQSLVDRPLGELLAAVMAHPDTPTQLYNDIADGWWACPRGPVCNSAELFQVLIDWAKAHPDEDPENPQIRPAVEKAAVLQLVKRGETPETGGKSNGDL
jgi:hypothetical protein